ncbi:MAG: hypothetical protein M1827_004579 [Pycnora praestabilis]|nr:MAG: hypothetical protein M1827_004579 [Pycnora praestabilis]
MILLGSGIFVLSSGLLASAQQLAQDPGAYGPALEIAHLYNQEFVTGIAVSSTGRSFSNYPRSLDTNNLAYTVAEIFSNNTEVPYPSAEINSPPGGTFNLSTYPVTCAGYQNYLIGVQSVVVDALDRLWILDTGRAALGTVNVPSSYGGPKLIGVNLSNNTIFQTIVFPPTVAYSTSYLNDVRFDLRANLTASGQGVAYITDSSNEGRNGIIIVDLGTGESWRHLDGIPQVRSEPQFLFTIWGQTGYMIPSMGQPGNPIGYETTGADGIALSADGLTLFWAPVASRYMYSVPTARLRDRSQSSEILAQASVVSNGQKGCSDGLETDSNGLIYIGNFEDNAINTYNPTNGTVQVFVRDPRIGWTDTMSIGTDGYIYFTENQYWRRPAFWNGTDLRQKPYVLFRAKLPNNGTKVLLK